MGKLRPREVKCPSTTTYSVSPRYESSSEDSSTAENFSDNESTENEAPEPEERVPSVAEAPQLRPKETAKAKTSREESQLSQESLHTPTAEGASGSSAKNEIRSVFWMGGLQAGPGVTEGDLCLRCHRSSPLRGNSHQSCTP